MPPRIYIHFIAYRSHFPAPFIVCFMEECQPVVSIHSSEEGALIEELCSQFPDEYQENPKLVRFMAACSLRNRRYEPASASKRLGKYLGWRKEIFGHCKDQSIEEDATLRDQIRAGLLYLCPTRLPNGAALIFIRMRHHNPSDFDSHTTMQYWHYMIMTSLIKDPLLAVHGFVFVNNFEGATLANTDIKVPTSISSALNKCMPVRVNSINFVNPPWVIRLVIPVVKTVLSAKLASRLNVILDAAELPGVLSISQEDLPTELGGQVEVDDPVGVLQIMVAENIVV